MSVKLFLLKSGEQIISEGKELFSGENSCGYLFENPLKVIINSPVFSSETEQPEVKVSLAQWIILTSDTQIAIPFDWVITVLEPIESLKQMYEEQINGQDN